MLKSRLFTRNRDLSSTRLRKTVRLSALIFFTVVFTLFVLTPWQYLPYPRGPHFTGAFSGVLKPGAHSAATHWTPVRLGGSPHGIVVPGVVAQQDALARSAPHDPASPAAAAPQLPPPAPHHVQRPDPPHALPVNTGPSFDETQAREERLRVGQSDAHREFGGAALPGDNELATVSDPNKNKIISEEGGGWEAEKDLVSQSYEKRLKHEAASRDQQEWEGASHADKNDSFEDEQLKDEGTRWEEEKDLVSGSDERRAARGAASGEEKERRGASEQGKEKEYGWVVENDIMSGSDAKESEKEQTRPSDDKQMDQVGREQGKGEGAGWNVEKQVAGGSDGKKEQGWAGSAGEKNLVNGPLGDKEVSHGESPGSKSGSSEVKIGDGNGSVVERNMANSIEEQRAKGGEDLASGSEVEGNMGPRADRESVAEGQKDQDGEDLAGSSKELEGDVEPKMDRESVPGAPGKKEDGAVTEEARDLMTGSKDKKLEANGEGGNGSKSEKMVTQKGEGEPEYKTGPLSNERGECLGHIMYDKPVKTGSSAVTVALRKFLDSKGQKYERCSFESCEEPTRAVCAGEREKVHFVEHISGREGLMECFGRLGYYRVTSIREPLERWESSFLYNRWQKTNHYGIAHNESYGVFMAKYPDCSLFDYYDGLGKRCEASKLGVDERVKRIVSSYEEIIDLYDEDEGAERGQLRRLLAGSLGKVNLSKRPDGDFREWFDEGRLGPEKKLYEALKKRQRELVGKERRLCVG